MSVVLLSGPHHSLHIVTCGACVTMRKTHARLTTQHALKAARNAKIAVCSVELYYFCTMNMFISSSSSWSSCCSFCHKTIKTNTVNGGGVGGGGNLRRHERTNAHAYSVPSARPSVECASDGSTARQRRRQQQQQHSGVRPVPTTICCLCCGVPYVRCHVRTRAPSDRTAESGVMWAPPPSRATFGRSAGIRVGSRLHLMRTR